MIGGLAVDMYHDVLTGQIAEGDIVWGSHGEGRFFFGEADVFGFLEWISRWI